MFSQLIEICRQHVESCTVIADTFRNIIVNLSDSASISCHIVATRMLLVATRQNSASISCHIIATRTLIVATHVMWPCLAGHR